MKRRLFFLIIVSVNIILFTSCINNQSNIMEASVKEYSSGCVNGQEYNSDFFGISFTCPEGYKILSKEECSSICSNVMENAGYTQAQTDEQQNVERIELLCISDDHNNSVTVSVIKKKTDADTPEMIITDTLNEIAKNTSYSDFTEVSDEYTIAGKNAKSVYMNINTNGMTGKQFLLVCEKYEYAFVVNIASYKDNPQDEIQSILNCFK